MTLLSICQQVAAKIPIAVPAAIIGNSNTNASLLLQSAQDVGEDMARRPQGGWLAMIMENDFQTAATNTLNGIVENTGPGGVAQIVVPDGIGATEPFTWYAFGTGLPNNSIVQQVNDPFTVTLNQASTQTGEGQFQFGQSDYPLPPAFERPVDNTMWDRSRFWSMRGPQSPQQWQLYKSSVIGRATIQRRWRIREINGNQVFSIDPVPLDNGSQLVFEYVTNAWCKSASGTPQPQWEADTDVGILDEYIMRLGVLSDMLRRLGMSYSEEMDKYERALARAIAADGGAAILDLTPRDVLALIGPANLPETNYGNMLGS